MRMKKVKPTRGDGGFSLIEVCFAVLIIGLGVLVLFGLFPAGMSESENAMSDTHIGLFAEAVMSGMRGNARGITNWFDWENDLEALVTADLDGISDTGDAVCDPPIEYPSGSGRYIQYILDVETNGVLGSAALWVSSGRYGGTTSTNFKEKAMWFYTEFLFNGM